MPKLSTTNRTGAPAPSAVSATLPWVWEAAGIWLLLVVLGVAWIAASLGALRDEESNALQQQRLTLTLFDLKEAIEADLALGFDLVDNPSLQARLDRALERDTELRAIDVASLAGHTLFSTDRGSVGEPLAPEVLAASRVPAHARRVWTTQVAGEPVIGIALQGPFGETAGLITSAYHRETTVAPGYRSTGVALLASLVVAVCGAAWAVQLLRRRQQAEAAEEARVLHDMSRASQGVGQRFEHCLMQVDESERVE